MAAYHVRSNSLPSRPHPLLPQVEENLCRIRASEGASSSSSPINHNLIVLQDLHDCVDKLVLLSLTQKALAQDQQAKLIDTLLDGSLRLLDICSTAKDALLQTKECTQEFLSIIRRRCGVEADVKKFLASRKMVKKEIYKAMGSLKGMQKQCDNNQETVAMVSMLIEVETVTLNVFKSLLQYISGSKSQLKRGGWMSKYDNSVLVENVQEQLKDLELCIQDLEGGLECLYRQLIKTRVSLLNVANH